MKKFSSTMKASSRRASQNKRLVRIVQIGIVALLLIFLVPRVLSFTASLVITPIISVQHYFSESTETIPSYFRDRDELLQIQHNLEVRIAEQAGSNLAVTRLTKENDLLRGLLSASTSVRIGAGVIGRPTALPYDVFVIDKGSNDNIRVNAPVYIGREQVIGFVVEVFNETAVVSLVTTPGLQSTVYIYGPDIYTTAIGMGAGSLRVSVPQGIVLTEGDLVIVPSFDSGVYGKITVIHSLPTKPEQYGYVSIDTPLASIQFVSVGEVPLHTISFDEAKKVVERTRFDLLQVPVPSGVLVDAGEATTTATSSAEGDITITE